MDTLSGKVTVITGGASGIGAATARLFAREGSKVVIADVLDTNGNKMVEELGDGATYVHTDVTQESDIRSALATAVQRYGRLDCLFNNAGAGGVDSPICDTDTTQLDATIALLFRAVVLGMKHAAPIMTQQGSGTIINTASVAGMRTGFGPHVYSALKAAVIHLTRSVAMELGESGVRVNAICPGGIITPIFGRSLGLPAVQAEERLPVLQEIFAEMQPIRRAGQPEDIAEAALWLASDSSTFVNGHALVVDGGVTGGLGWTQARTMFDNLREVLGVEG